MYPGLKNRLCAFLCGVVALGAAEYGPNLNGHVRTFHFISDDDGGWVQIGQELRTFLASGHGEQLGKTVSLSQDGRTLAIGGNPVS